MSIPTNIADAIAQIRDGDIQITEIKIGDLVVSALTGLRVTRRKDVTRRPVQAGYSVALGVIDTPVEIEMDIVFANPDYAPEDFVTAALTGSMSGLTETWREKRDSLVSLFETKEVISITTHDEGFQSFVIESIDPVYDPEEDVDGWIGNVRLVEFSQSTGTTVVDLESAKTAAKAYLGRF